MLIKVQQYVSAVIVHMTAMNGKTTIHTLVTESLLIVCVGNIKGTYHMFSLTNNALS